MEFATFRLVATACKQRPNRTGTCVGRIADVVTVAGDGTCGPDRVQSADWFAAGAGVCRYGHRHGYNCLAGAEGASDCALQYQAMTS
jgi:hypothetical protein